MQLNFTVNCIVDIPNSEVTAKVASVLNMADEDITKHFFRFCQEKCLPLTSEDEIASASLAYCQAFHA